MADKPPSEASDLQPDPRLDELSFLLADFDLGISAALRPRRRIPDYDNRLRLMETKYEFPLIKAIGLNNLHLNVLDVLLAFSLLDAPIAIVKVSLDELNEVIRYQHELSRQNLIMAAERLRVLCKNRERWNANVMTEFFTLRGKELQNIVSNEHLNLLMIGENPTLSSATALLGIRQSLANFRPTGLNVFQPIQDVLETHLDRIEPATFEARCIFALRDTIPQAGFNYFNILLSDPHIAILDCTDADSYSRAYSLYSIVFGHCLYPTFAETQQGITPFLLLSKTLAAIKGDTATHKDPRPILVIFTIPSKNYEEEYDLPRLIETSRSDYQYLGANRSIEETILRFGYKHERRMKSHYDGIHRVHPYVTANLLAHSFLLKRGNSSS